MNLFRFIPGYEGSIFDEGKEPVFLLLLAFLIAQLRLLDLVGGKPSPPTPQRRVS